MKPELMMHVLGSHNQVATNVPKLFRGPALWKLPPNPIDDVDPSEGKIGRGEGRLYQRHKPPSRGGDLRLNEWQTQPSI